MKVRREQRLGCPKLSTQFTLNAHPKVFNVLGVDGVIIRIHKMLMMDDDIMSVNSMVDVFDLSVLKLKVLKFKAFLTLNILRRLTETKYFLKILRRLTEALPQFVFKNANKIVPFNSTKKTKFVITMVCIIYIIIQL